MKEFRFFFNAGFILFFSINLSCSNEQSKLQVQKEIIAPDVEKITETKAEVIWQNDELTAKGITQNRNLSEYEQGGHFTKGGLIKENPCFDCGEKSGRDFIWKNWTEKKRGYIRITYHGTDAFSTSHIFIEPNEKGEWRIAWRIARQHTSSEYDNLITDIPTIIEVDRIEDKSEKDEWALIFKNKIGEIVQKLPYFYIKK